MIFHVLGNDYESKFIRTCPVGVKSCFGAKGFYDRDDEKVSNDICKLKFSPKNKNNIEDYLYDEFSNKKICIHKLFVFLAVAFFGCSEARHKQDYGCDEDDQTLDVLDKFKKKVQV